MTKISVQQKHEVVIRGTWTSAGDGAGSIIVSFELTKFAFFGRGFD